MGKVTRGRSRKYHAAAGQQSKQDMKLPRLPYDTTETIESHTLTTHMINNNKPLLDAHKFSNCNDLFSGVTISIKDLTQNLNNTCSTSVDDDTKSFISKTYDNGDRLKKCEKRQLRRETFLTKLNAARHAEVDAKERMKRQQTVITGDMQLLADALPDLPAQVHKSRHTKNRSVPKIKKRQQMLLEDYAWMKRAMQNNSTDV